MTGQLPYGSLSTATAVTGSDGIRFQGWAVDPGQRRRRQPGARLRRQPRGGRQHGCHPDRRRPQLRVGPGHGFDYTMTGIAAGTHQACAYSYRPSGGTLLGCRTVSLNAVAPTPVAPDSSTIGSFDTASTITGGTRVSGWALDRGTTASIGLHVYIDAPSPGRPPPTPPQ